MEKDLSYIKSFLKTWTPYKDGRWCYEDGCVMIGCIALYRATGDEDYRNFVLNRLDSIVLPDGSIPGYSAKQYSIDDILSGRALFFAYEQTGDEKYRQAIEFHMQRLNGHPRCMCGSFWHKENYPNQVWLDGLYMAEPFYTEYEMRFDEGRRLDDILRQFKNVRAHLWDAEKCLNYHGWDESLQQPWCNHTTGTSANFWLRSTGWYLMALIDCIGLCEAKPQELIDIFRETLDGLLRYQDPETGLFWQVIDHPEAEGNYLETSGSAMAACVILKGVRLGVLDEATYLPKGLAIYRAIVKDHISADSDGALHLNDICLVAGLGPGEKRDGSVAYYLSEPIVADDAKGVGPFMMACAEYQQAKK